jgi:hypothetical protein
LRQQFAHRLIELQLAPLDQCMQATAVTAFVIDQIQNTLSAAMDGPNAPS